MPNIVDDNAEKKRKKEATSCTTKHLSSQYIMVTSFWFSIVIDIWIMLFNAFCFVIYARLILSPSFHWLIWRHGMR
jgi:ABC-type protease/lipase transport system fused ATPase/permease subunit